MLTLLNNSILTADGDFRLKTVNLSQAKMCVLGNNLDVYPGHQWWQSAIGHQATADILTELLGEWLGGPVPVNRIEYQQNVGDVALVLKLKGRAPEGAILTREQLEAIGYEFKILTRLK